KRKDTDIARHTIGAIGNCQPAAQASRLPKNGFAPAVPLAIQVSLIIEQPIISRKNSERSASVRPALLGLIVLFVAVLAVFFSSTRRDRNSSGTQPLFVYCAASVKPPLEAA